MILHRLLLQHLKHADDPDFYSLQARDAIRWLVASGVALGPETRALDLGCGHGILGAELAKHGCPVTFADESNILLPEVKGTFRPFNIDRQPLAELGRFDLVICSNVYEHLARRAEFIAAAHELLTEQGRLYLSWTNWLSPWGGHEFSPLHYLGARNGPRVWDALIKRPRKHTPFENLYPTYIGETFGFIRRNPHLRVLRAAPRYYTEFAWLVRVPVVREFLTWNCALLLARV